MEKVFIIHGFQGSPNGGWRPWLMGELEKIDVYACALAMPNPNDPVPEEWVKEIARHVDSSPKDGVFLVGHSLGVPAILRFLEKTHAKNIKGLVLVSGPLAKTKNRKVNAFLKEKLDLKKIHSCTNEIIVIHGDDDGIVPPRDAAELAGVLGAELIMIKKGGHLNGSSGWMKLPQCLSSLRRMMKIV